MGETEREKAQPRMNYEKILLDMQVKETYSLGTSRDSGLRKDKCDGGQEGPLRVLIATMMPEQKR